MQKFQLDALQSYIVSVVRLMTKQDDHGSCVRLMLTSKYELEAAFGVVLPTEYPDLLPSTMPDLL